MPSQRSRSGKKIDGVFVNTTIAEQEINQSSYRMADLIGASLTNRAVQLIWVMVEFLPLSSGTSGVVQGTRTTEAVLAQIGYIGPIWSDDQMIPSCTQFLLNKMKPVKRYVKCSGTKRVVFDEQNQDNNIWVTLNQPFTESVTEKVLLRFTTKVRLLPQQKVEKVSGRPIST